MDQHSQEIIGPPYGFIADGLKKGRVIPFFGAAASAVYRPLNETWQPGKPFMPFGGELAMTLASAANYPKALIGGSPDLALIASWAEHVQGTREYVNENLHKCFAVECNPGELHETIAGIDAAELFITTNYDDLLEKALAFRNPHLIVDRGSQGHLLVSAAGKDPELVSRTGSRMYELLNDEKTQRPSRPVLFKMHGSVDKANPDNDCYLITEEDYVDFLGRDKGYYIPPYVNALMQGKDFLFLGYSLSDWNVRVILRKLLKRPTGRLVKFWAIVSGKSHVEQQLWQAHNLNIYTMDLQAFAKELKNHL
jgi:hypothetical protein